MSVCADESAHNIHIGLENWKFVGNSVLCHKEAESRPGNVQAYVCCFVQGPYLWPESAGQGWQTVTFLSVE